MSPSNGGGHTRSGLNVPRAENLVFAGVPFDDEREPIGAREVVVDGFALVDCAGPPLLIEDGLNAIAGLPLALDGIVVVVTQDDEVGYSIQVVVSKEG